MDRPASASKRARTHDSSAEEPPRPRPKGISDDQCTRWARSRRHHRRLLILYADLEDGQERLVRRSESGQGCIVFGVEVNVTVDGGHDAPGATDAVFAGPHDLEGSPDVDHVLWTALSSLLLSMFVHSHTTNTDTRKNKFHFFSKNFRSRSNSKVRCFTSLHSTKDNLFGGASPWRTWGKGAACHHVTGILRYTRLVCLGLRVPQYEYTDNNNAYAAVAPAAACASGLHDASGPRVTRTMVAIIMSASAARMFQCISSAYSWKRVEERRGGGIPGHQLSKGKVVEHLHQHRCHEQGYEGRWRLLPMDARGKRLRRIGANDEAENVHGRGTRAEGAIPLAHLGASPATDQEQRGGDGVHHEGADENGQGGGRWHGLLWRCV